MFLCSSPFSSSGRPNRFEIFPCELQMMHRRCKGCRRKKWDRDRPPLPRSGEITLRIRLRVQLIFSVGVPFTETHSIHLSSADVAFNLTTASQPATTTTVCWWGSPSLKRRISSNNSRVNYYVVKRCEGFSGISCPSFSRSHDCLDWLMGLEGVGFRVHLRTIRTVVRILSRHLKSLIRSDHHQDLQSVEICLMDGSPLRRLQFDL